jgi:hypothetical protein
MDREDSLRKDSAVTVSPGNQPVFDLAIFEKMQPFAEYLSKSMTIPERYQRKPADIVTAFLKGQELGLAPIASLEAFNMIQGTSCLTADFFLALIQSHPAYDGHEEMTFSKIEEAGKAVCTFIRKGKRYTREFSIKDAQRRGHWGKRGPWSTDPWRMLQIRARTFAGRDAFSDALKGFTTEDEVRDIHELKAAENSRGTSTTRVEQVAALTTGGDEPKVVEAEFEVAVKPSKPADDKRHREPVAKKAPAKPAKKAPPKPRSTEQANLLPPPGQGLA